VSLIVIALNNNNVNTPWYIILQFHLSFALKLFQVNDKHVSCTIRTMYVLLRYYGRVWSKTGQGSDIRKTYDHHNAESCHVGGWGRIFYKGRFSTRMSIKSYNYSRLLNLRRYLSLRRQECILYLALAAVYVRQ